MPRLLSLLITFWAGSLWTICGVVAPSLFSVAGDRRIAGQLAAHFFRAEAVIGLIMGVVLLALTAVSASALANFRARALIATTAALPLLSEFAVGPQLDRARAVGDMTQFGLLHGIAAGLFLIACVSALLLVWEFTRRVRRGD